MKLRITLLILFCMSIISCRQTEKSNEVMKEALDVYFSSDIPENSRIEKSLELTNEALELDNKSISALSHKTTLLFRKKDVEGLLQTVDELITLMPDKPYYLVQKAFYLEFKGDNANATEHYDSAFRNYHRHLSTDSLNINLWLEYIGLLEITGDTTSASDVLANMDRMNFDDSQKEILRVYKTKVYKTQLSSMDKIRKYWDGEIGYEQLEEK